MRSEILNLAKRQIETSNKIAESLSMAMTADKELRTMITSEYIRHIDKISAERDQLLAEVKRLTEMLSCMQHLFADTMKSNNIINIK